MYQHKSLDAEVRARLRRWPQRPPGMGAVAGEAWLRARPAEGTGTFQPFLKLLGSDRLRTLPDGLWLRFGGTHEEPFADVFAIEACSSMQNLMDKRSRFAPSTQSLLAVCPLPWLLRPVADDSTTLRWQATGLIHQSPVRSLILPVRDLRVLYGLKSRQYLGFTQSQVPHPHEYFAPMDALVAENGDANPALMALVARASTSANFYCNQRAAGDGPSAAQAP